MSLTGISLYIQVIILILIGIFSDACTIKVCFKCIIENVSPEEGICRHSVEKLF